MIFAKMVAILIQDAAFYDRNESLHCFTRKTPIVLAENC
jgi:hypothetical protein